MKKNAVTIEFPLRGEWVAPTTPAKRIPSHGTNRMGLKYAFDFLQVDQNNMNKFYDASTFRFLILGVPLKKCYCYGRDIYAPCDGEVVAKIDGIPERKHVHWLRESIIGIKKSLTFNEETDDFSIIAGNFIIIKCSENVYMAFVHLQTDSIAVSLNEKIPKGSFLGKVGHSGNSTSPHLHFQVMDSSDLKNANGIPCFFEKYQIYQHDTWKTVHNQIPSEKDRIRFNKNQ